MSGQWIATRHFLWKFRCILLEKKCGDQVPGLLSWAALKATPHKNSENNISDSYVNKYFNNYSDTFNHGLHIHINDKHTNNHNLYYGFVRFLIGIENYYR